MSGKENNPLVIGADVGGTNTKIALARFEGSRAHIVKRMVYPSGRYPALEVIVDEFMSTVSAERGSGAITAACFAVAGPVENGHARLTNLPWVLDAAALARRFGFSVRVINDFEAAGLGIDHLQPSDVITLQPGTPVERADRVVVGAGTGLGVAWLTWEQAGYDVHPSEAGHMDFAPIDDLQDELLLYLRRELGHVSVERVVSGPGLPRIFAFLKNAGAAAPTQALLDAMERGDAAGAITEFALSGRDELAVRALDVFASAYGAFTGNMALATLPMAVFMSAAASRRRLLRSSPTARSCAPSQRKAACSRCWIPYQCTL